MSTKSFMRREWLHDIINALDRKQYCVALFVDLSKAFDYIDHKLLLGRFKKVAMDDKAIELFKNDPADRPQCVYTYGHKSRFMELSKGVPQGSILGPVLFSVFFMQMTQ